MTLADRLGNPQPAPSSECAVCRWLDGAAVSDREAFDRWIATGGAITALWRACASDPDNPLTIKRPRFAELINDHHRGGARDAI